MTFKTKIHALLVAAFVTGSANSMAEMVFTGGGWVDASQALQPEVASVVTGGLDAMAPNSYGTSDVAISVVPWTSFRPRTSSGTYSSGPGFNRMCLTGGNAYVYAALPDDIPDGAIVTQLGFYAYDGDATDDFVGQLAAYFADSSNGSNWTYQSLVLTSATSGTPGDTVSGANISLLIDRRQDIDSDSTTEVVSYVLQPFLGSSGNVCVSQARILWKRQVSPPPASATFSDVSTGHPFFQYIEAMAASGITSGCSATNYCPDDPLTRGQMAVFLSKALGLHWPAF